MNYYLCSQAVIDHFTPEMVSKPFKSGYRDDNDLYYVAWLNFEEVDQYYTEVIEPYNEKSRVADIDFWLRECVPGSMDDSRVTLAGARRRGLFREIEEKTNLTAVRNQAMIIYNLAERFGCTPIEFVNRL